MAESPTYFQNKANNRLVKVRAVSLFRFYRFRGLRSFLNFWLGGEISFLVDAKELTVGKFGGGVLVAMFRFDF